MEHGRVLHFLKERTAPQHESLECRVDLANRLRDPGAYAGLLGCFHGFYAPLEDALGRVAGFEAVGIDFGARRKTPWLAADLAALGRRPGEFPLCESTPAVDSLGRALGCLYVLEGATLGGKVVTKMVASRLGLTPGRGCAFFASYGDRVGAMWGEFRSALADYTTAPAREEEILSAAAETFDALGHWLAAAEVTT